MEQAPPLSIVFLGHRNCGKSTLNGKLIYEVKKSQGLLKNLNSFYGQDVASLPPSFLVDKVPEERERSQTLGFSINTLTSSKYEFTIFNVPGRRDLLKHATRGASQADAAVLVISALTEEFEIGMHDEGMTKWHAVIAHALGIEQFIVCITKIDEEEVDFSEDRFNEIQEWVSECLDKIGISLEKVQFIPVSGLTGENVIIKSKRLNWYKGPTLIEAMKNFKVQKYKNDGPLRITVLKTERIRGSKDVTGTIQSGTIASGAAIKFAILNLPMKTWFIFTSGGEKLSIGQAGTTIRFHLPQIIASHLKSGDIIGRQDVNPPYPCKEFVAKIMILNHPNQIKVGYSPVISVHAANVSCRFEEIIEKFDKESGKVLTDQSKILKNGDAAIVRMRPLNALCVEAFQDVPRLGRFIIRDISRVIGTGIVKSVVLNTNTEQKPISSFI